jgi:hypothetical protein
MHGFGELAGEFQIRRAGFAPHQVGVVSVSDSAGDGLVQTLLGLVEAFGGTLARQERLVVLVVVGGQQVSSFGIGTGDHQGRHAIDVGAIRAAISFWIASVVGTRTLPPMWPHFLTEASWSSQCTPAAPARIMAFISS